MGIRAANKPVTDDEGFVTAKVTRVVFGEGTTKGKDGEVEVYDRLEISLEMSGTVSPIKTTVFTGTVLNDATPGKGGKSQYNRLTRLSLALGLVKESDLKDIKPATMQACEDGLQALEGQLVSFKMGVQPGRSLPVPILETFDKVVVTN